MTDNGELKAECINRITREVRKAVPDWRKIISKTEDLSESDLTDILIDKDTEVRAELNMLIGLIITEAEND